MFGYVNIQKDKLTEGERGLYQTFMCGLCMSTKKFFPDIARMTVNYDINFFNMLFHSVAEEDVEILRQRCVAHPFRKRTILKMTDITDKLAVANIMLVYLNILDDVQDGGSLKKKTALKFFRRSYRIAENKWKEVARMLNDNYNRLREAEQRSTDNLDAVCHHFANLSAQLAKMVMGEKCNEFLYDLCYNIGKWIYLIDALDDVAKDIGSHNYNAFLQYYNGNSTDVIKENLEEITFIMYAVLNKIASCYNDLNLTKYRCLLNNVIYGFIRQKTKEVLDKYKE